MKQLHSTTRTILIVAFLLVINAICIFAYRDAVLTYETQKDSMLNFTIKYETLAGSLRSDAALHYNTGNPAYLHHFDQTIRNYYYEDSIDLGYHIITAAQVPNQWQKQQTTPVLTLDAQVGFLRFTQEEETTYLKFRRCYDQLLQYYKDARSTSDFSLLQSTEFYTVHNAQFDAMSLLNQRYIDRMNAQEDRVLANQSIMELTLICLSVLLLFLATFTFYLLIRENAYNSYFRKLYSTVVENVNVGLSIVDESGTYDYINPTYMHLLDMKQPHYIGKTCDQLFPPQTAKLLHVCGNDPTQGHLNLEVQGEKRYIDYNHFIIFDEKNNKKYIDLLHDRTETEHMQQQLRNQLREIELYSHAKDSFLANISHEIKTPINAIVGMTHFLKQSELTLRQQDIVSKIQSSSDVLLSIINDVLDFSKIKAQSLNLYPTVFRLDSLLRNIEDMFGGQIQAKGLVFECRYAVPEQVCLRLDRTRLIQILVNLLGNAYKFTDSGRISLIALAKEETDSVMELEFCIEDTGIGIEKKNLTKLFQEFEQIENHLTKKHEGTGLGLSICKHIVEAMGGNMWVTSTPGLGSKFYFSIPCPKATAEQLPASTVLSDEENQPLNGHGAHVLVAEDTDINMEIVTKLLQDANIVCHPATDGVEAVDLCKEHPQNFFRLILMDIHMPRMDGYTASRIIKEQLQVTTPILALTATSMEEAASQQKNDVMDGYILKPFKIEEFYRLLKPFFPKTGDPYGGSEEAIHNLGGAQALYFKHVTRFKANYNESGSEIKEFLQMNNTEEAARKAHTVKGLAGTLGMPRLQEAADALRTYILHSDTPSDQVPGLDMPRNLDGTPTNDLEAVLGEYQLALEEVLTAEPEGFGTLRKTNEII